MFHFHECTASWVRPSNTQHLAKQIPPSLKGVPNVRFRLHSPEQTPLAHPSLLKNKFRSAKGSKLHGRPALLGTFHQKGQKIHKHLLTGFAHRRCARAQTTSHSERKHCSVSARFLTGNRRLFGAENCIKNAVFTLFTWLFALLKRKL